MNSLSDPSRSPASVDSFRSFAADPKNRDRVIIDATEGQQRAQKREEAFKKNGTQTINAEGQKIEFTFPSSGKSSADVMNDFVSALELEYGTQVANWAFPKEKRDEAIANGLSPKMINEALSRGDVNMITGHFDSGLRGKLKYDKGAAPLTINDNRPKITQATAAFSQGPISKEDADKIIAEHEEKTGEDLSPTWRDVPGNIEQQASSITSDHTDEETKNLQKSPLSDVSEKSHGWMFFDPKKDLTQTKSVFEGESKVQHEWAFLKADIQQVEKKIGNKFSQGTIVKEKQDEYDQELQKLGKLAPKQAKKDLLKKFDDAVTLEKTKAEQELKILQNKLRKLENEHPFLG